MKEFVDAVKRLVDLMPTGAALPHFYARDELVKVRKLLGTVQTDLEQIELLIINDKLKLSKRHQEIVDQRNLLTSACKSVITTMDKADQREMLWQEVCEAITQVEGLKSGGFMWYRPNPFYCGGKDERT